MLWVINLISCAVIGATGLVGSTFLKLIDEVKPNIDRFVFYASERSAGKKITVLGNEYIIQELTEATPNKKFNFAMFFAGGKISEKYAKLFTKEGTTVIDNSSFFRMDDDVPLVVPEINIDSIKNSKLIANPNCSTIQAVVALWPLHKKYKIKRIVYTTFQAVSGAGKKGIDDLEITAKGGENKKFPHKIYNNCIPHIDDFTENGYTKEELKMINETHKIFNDDSIKITATCVRVPVVNCHSESINVEFEHEVDIQEARQLLANSPGIIVEDEPKFNIYPLNEFANNTDDVIVGRIRKDFSTEHGLNLWVVADNIRKGAATNAMQILLNLL